MLGSPDNGVPAMMTRAAQRRRLWMPLLIAAIERAKVTVDSIAEERESIDRGSAKLIPELVR